MGIRTKIRLGFFSLGLLLTLAAVISYSELARLNDITYRIINEGATSVKLSNDILDALSREDANIVNYFQNQDSIGFNTVSNEYLVALDSVLFSMKDSFPENKLLDTLIERKSAYDKTITSFSATNSEDKIRWYFGVYKPSYNKLVVSVKNFMRSTQDLVTEESTNIQSSVHRAIMQGTASIGTTMVLILMFYFLIDIYYISPTIKITKGLKNYLTLRIPFKVEVTGKDEVSMLKEYIEQLMARLKAKKSSDESIRKN